MLGILAGFGLLLLSFYVIYLGANMESGLIKFLGILIGTIGGIMIAISRLKINVKALEKYKHSLRELSKHPNDEKLKEAAYQLGIEYYRNKRDDRKQHPMDEYIVQRDLQSAISKKSLKS